MPVNIREVEFAQCKICGYEWMPKPGTIPATCANPKCRSRYWQTGAQRPSIKEQREAAAIEALALKLAQAQYDKLTPQEKAAVDRELAGRPVTEAVQWSMMVRTSARAILGKK